MTVVRVSSIQQPANTGEKCQGTISPGTGTERHTQATSASCPLSNCDEGSMARWDWLGAGSLGGSAEHSGDFEGADGWPVNLESPNLATHYKDLHMPQGRLRQRGYKLYGRLSNSLNNTEKGYHKPRAMLSLKYSRDSLGVCMSSSQYWLPGFHVSIYKLFKRLEVSELKV